MTHMDNSIYTIIMIINMKLHFVSKQLLVNRIENKITNELNDRFENNTV